MATPQNMSTTFFRFPTGTQLSVLESAILHARWAWSGLVDANRWLRVISAIFEDAELRANVLQSALVNSLVLIFLHAFVRVINFADGLGRLPETTRDIYQLIWTLPLVLGSLYLNATFCARTAKRAFTLVHGSRSYIEAGTPTGPLLSKIATSAPRWVMLLISFAIDLALRYIPVVGHVLAFVFLCWVDAYYFFEFVWTGRGMPLAQRVQHLEERWAYYLGFGLPSAVLLTIASSSSLSNATLFALIFPVHIVLATHARPQPTDPHELSAYSRTDTALAPSPFLPLRLRVLSPVLWIDALILSVLTGIDTRLGGGAGVAHARSSEGAPQQSQRSFGGTTAMGRRAFATYRGVDGDSMEGGWGASKFA